MICELCKLNVDEKYITKHHLIPKTYHNNKKAQKQFTSNEMNFTINLCISCHKKIHSCLKEKDLAFKYNTIQKLLTVPEIKKWYNWRNKHPNFNDGVSKQNSYVKN